MTGYYTIQKIAALHDNFDLKKQTSIQKCQLAFIPLVKKPISVLKGLTQCFIVNIYLHAVFLYESTN